MNNPNIFVSFIRGPRSGETNVPEREENFPLRYDGGEYRWVEMNEGGPIAPGAPFPLVVDDHAIWYEDPDQSA